MPSRAYAADLLLGEGFRGFFITPMTDEEIKEKRRVYAATYYAKNKEKIKAASAKWQAENPEKNREHMLKATARWKKRNPEKLKAQKARYYAKNKERFPRTDAMRLARTVRKKQRKAEDPVYAMAERLRNRLLMAFKNGGFKKQSTTEKMIGCTFKQFTKHIETQFTGGMSWDNRADWQLDHIIPLSCATTIEGLEKLSHYTNIRPLWAAENLAKSNHLVLI